MSIPESDLKKMSVNQLTALLPNDARRQVEGIRANILLVFTMAEDGELSQTQWEIFKLLLTKISMPYKV